MRLKLVKWGSGTAIRLPAAVLDIAGFSVGQDVEISARAGVVELRSKPRIPTIEELLAEAEKEGPLEPPESDPDEWVNIAPTDEEMGSAEGGRPDSQRR